MRAAPVASDDLKGIDSVAKQVTCDSCRLCFLVPEEIGDYWVLCPYCEKVNPRAQQDLHRLGRGRGYFGGCSFLSVIGTFLLVAGVLGTFLGTIVVFLDLFFFRYGLIDFSFIVTGLTLVASLALVIAGSLLLYGDAKPAFANLGWKLSAAAVLTMIVGICGWLFVFGACNPLPM